MGDDQSYGPDGPYGPPSPGDPSSTEDVPGYETPDPGWAPPGYGTTGGAGFPGGPDDLYGGQAGWAPPGWGQPPGAPGSGPGSPGWSGPPSGFAEPPSRRRRPAVRLAALVVTLVLIGAVVLPVVILTGVGSSSTSSQASSLFTAAMTAAGSSAGVHYASEWTGGGAPTTFSGDAGQNDGTQVVTEPTDFGTEQYDVVLAANQTLYVEGNAAALEDELGVTAGAAPGLAGKWISLQTADAPYNEEEGGLTISSEVGIPGFKAGSTEQVTGAGGTTLTRIDGTVPASDGFPAATVEVDISPATDLPVTIVVSYGGSGEDTITYSQWGTAPAVTVPTGAVAWSSLPTSEPPDGYGSGETPTPSAVPAATPTPSAAAGG